MSFSVVLLCLEYGISSNGTLENLAIDGGPKRRFFYQFSFGIFHWQRIELWNTPIVDSKLDFLIEINLQMFV